MTSSPRDGSTPESEPRPITRVAEVPVFENDYGTLYNDRVLAPGGESGHYLRWRWKQAGVIVVPRSGNRYGLKTMFRYPIGGRSLEVPRGGRRADEPLEAAAQRELAEEMGLRSRSIVRVGECFADSGLIENPVAVTLAEVDAASQTAAAAEPFESLGARIEWLTPERISAKIRDGSIRCGLTIAALTMCLGYSTAEAEAPPP